MDKAYRGDHKKNVRCCLTQGGVETATMKQIFFGKFEKLWKTFSFRKNFFKNSRKPGNILEYSENWQKNYFPLKSFKKITEVH